MSGAGAVRIAMWSGPRNISTAMMRSWEARGDCVVADEPLYAHYLIATGRDHPGAAEVIASQDGDWRRVTKTLCGPIPGGKAIWFQKHMAHHLLAGMERGWIGGLRNAMLIREPRAMLASLARVIPNPGVEETGLPQQVELFEWLAARGGAEASARPVVVDARDVLMNPAGVMRALCAALDVPYTERMLRWAPGLRATDGVWARHWYGNVMRSTGFEAARENAEEVPAHLRGVLRECEGLYEKLWAQRVAAQGEG